MNTDLATTNKEQFELAQRQAKMFASSTLVPKDYQNNIPNVLIAMNMARQLNADVMQIMQHLYIVHGSPAWSAQFLIGCFNTCGRFSAIKYKFNADKTACTAYATEIATGDVVEGTTVTIDMAKKEGWYSKRGSKWQTMPEHMLRYRAATFLIRTTAPELGMGIVTDSEAQDITPDAPRRAELRDTIDRWLDQGAAETPVSEPDDALQPDPASPLTDQLTAAKTLADVDAVEAVFVKLAKSDHEREVLSFECDARRSEIGLGLE